MKFLDRQQHPGWANDEGLTIKTSGAPYITQGDDQEMSLKKSLKHTQMSKTKFSLTWKKTKSLKTYDNDINIKILNFLITSNKTRAEFPNVMANKTSNAFPEDMMLLNYIIAFNSVYLVWTNINITAMSYLANILGIISSDKPSSSGHNNDSVLCRLSNVNKEI